MSNIPEIFDSKKLKSHKDRASKNFLKHNYLSREIDSRNFDKILEIRGNYKNILLIGFTSNWLIDKIIEQYPSSNIFTLDISISFLNIADKVRKVISKDDVLPFKEQSFDLVIASPHCSFVNDLPGLFFQARKILNKKGVFISSLFSANNLYEIKNCLQEAEIEVKNGFSPRFSPLVEIKSVASLVQKIGFIEPITDLESIKFSYDNIIDLMHDLRFTALNNSMFTSSILTKEILTKAQIIYSQKYNDDDNGIVATYNIVNITALA